MSATVRESPALDVMYMPSNKSALLSVIQWPFCFYPKDGHILNSVELTSVVINSADCIIIFTDHSSYDFSKNHRFNHVGN
jgi:UDP-N-acetyl-D-mannosaminuronate dehydrogenase